MYHIEKGGMVKLVVCSPIELVRGSNPGMIKKTASFKIPLDIKFTINSCGFQIIHMFQMRLVL
jgi:hypothetical protein